VSKAKLEIDRSQIAREHQKVRDELEMDEEHDTSEHSPHASKTTDGSSSGIDRIVAR
jgi:hypothetical protein